MFTLFFFFLTECANTIIHQNISEDLANS